MTSLAAGLLTVALAACGGGASGPGSKTDTPGGAGSAVGGEAAFSTVKTDLVPGISTASYADDGRGVKTDVPRFGSARNLTQAVDIVRHKDMRDAHWDGATKVSVSSQVIASSPDVLGVAVTSAVEGPKAKTVPATLWYDARRSQTYSSPILIEPAQWKSFADQVRDAAGKVGADPKAVDEALVATPAPYGNGPAMGFNSGGDLVLQFAGGVLGAEPKGLVVPAGDVAPRLSEFGALAQQASQQPSAFSGKPSKQLPRFSPATRRPPKGESPNSPTDGNASKDVPKVTPGGAVRPSTAVGVDCIVKDCVALTYDDGPGPDTPKLLATLDKERVAATFFQLGNSIDARPEVVKQVASDGYEIGNHTLTHPDLARQSPERVKKEVNGNSEKLAKLIGAKPLIFRPPYGSHKQEVRDVVGADDMSIIQWNVDSNDWKSKNAAATQQEAVSGALNVSQPIVLMHDIHATTIEAAPQIVSMLKQNNMTFVTVSELSINTGGLQPGHAYCSGTGLQQQGFGCKG